MHRFKKLFIYCLSLSLVAGFAFSCAKKGPTPEERIKTLSTKGVPDSSLSNVKLYLYNISSFEKIGQPGKVRQYKDSLKTGLLALEAWYEKVLVDNKAFIETTRKTIESRKANLKGLPLKDCDSLLKVADSLTSINFLIPAREKFEKILAVLPILEENQTRAAEILPKLYGTWKDVHAVRPPEEEEGPKYKATETRIYTFEKDGKFNAIEEMHGQTTPYMKEDWKFVSWGDYDLMGDSIYLFVKREKCDQQIFTQLNIKTNKWDRNVKPTYDSTVTTNKKDKFITFDDLKIGFKKIR